MSDPIERYNPGYYGDMIYEPRNGEWVEYSEYEKLKAEVERLTNENGNNSFMKEEWYLKCMSARAEVERLRKAGDRLAGVIGLPVNDVQTNALVESWNAAKEGKPSEQKSPSFIEDLGNGVEKHDLLFRHPAKEGKQP